jgi:hypothetical protein
MSAPVSSIWGTKEFRRRELNPNPMIGGNCAIVAGFLGILQGIVAIAGGSAAIGFSIVSSGFLVLLGLISIAFGFLCVLGGLDARLRRRYKQSLIRVILGMAVIGFGVGALLALVAVILIALSQDEFDVPRY